MRRNQGVFEIRQNHGLSVIGSLHFNCKNTTIDVRVEVKISYLGLTSSCTVKNLSWVLNLQSLFLIFNKLIDTLSTRPLKRLSFARTALVTFNGYVH